MKLSLFRSIILIASWCLIAAVITVMNTRIDNGSIERPTIWQFVGIVGFTLSYLIATSLLFKPITRKDK